MTTSLLTLKLRISTTETRLIDVISSCLRAGVSDLHIRDEKWGYDTPLRVGVRYPRLMGCTITLGPSTNSSVLSRLLTELPSWSLTTQNSSAGGSFDVELNFAT